jgi:hypothetical protein
MTQTLCENGLAGMFSLVTRSTHCCIMQDCEHNQLLDDARRALSSATLNIRKAALLVGALYTCAEDAQASGDTTAEKMLSKAAAELERRLLSE